MSSRRDITITQGDVYTHVITFDESQDGYTFTAELSDGTDFTVSADSDTQVTVSLSSATTTALTETLYHWKFRRSDEVTFLQGKVSMQ